eukprot:TRINITY_DN23206_c0_g1_i1.p1 TRINITY_DN23206_c0_g1~~TRINITY_DN23206_c0_g1_i1.p1  ORF type:complete len:744 (+),score=257.81 TRINITY_DN23206_c0_g1_i1:43-2274(+)
MRVYFQALGCDGHCSGPLMLVFDEQRFLFDAPEGTQRYCTECKVKMQKVQGVFITRTHPDTLLGLPGLLLTLREIERTRGPNSHDQPRSITAAILQNGGVTHTGRADLMTIAGPESLKRVLDETEPFLKCPNFYEITAVPEAVAVPPAAPADGGASTAPSTPLVVHSCSSTPKFTISAHCERGRVSYSLNLAAQPGKFIAEKAKELGVNGRKRAQLKDGVAVESDTQPGRIVQPHEVLGPGTPGQHVVITAGPLTDTLTSFSTPPPGEQLLAVMHLTPPAEQDDAYRASYLASTPLSGARHYFASARGGTVYQSSALQHDRLRAISPTLFPEELCGWGDAPQHIISQGVTSDPRHWELKEMSIFNVVANDAMRAQESSSPREALQIESGRAEWPAELAEARRSVDVSQPAGGGAVQCPNVTMLGTGGMMPSKYRNVTSMLLEYRRGEYALLDTGEGTLGQIRRCRPAREVLGGLRLVWISHIHADHHAGLATLLCHRAQLFPELSPVAVVGPASLEPYLAEFSKEVPLNYAYTHCALGEIPVCEGVTLRNVPVDHCGDAWGCVLQGAEGWRIVNSGDTRPCEALVEAGEGCDLLIHEATFEDDKQQDAEGKKHSTVSEALGVAERMRSKQTVLTHFSQRYPKTPPRVDQGAASVALAFDMMLLTPSSAPELHRMNAGLKVLEAYYEALEEKRRKEAEAATSARKAAESRKRGKQAGPDSAQKKKAKHAARNAGKAVPAPTPDQ